MAGVFDPNIFDANVFDVGEEAGVLHPSHDKLPPLRRGPRGRTPPSVLEELRRAEEERQKTERRKQKSRRRKPAVIEPVEDDDFDIAARARVDAATLDAATKAAALIVETQGRQAAEAEQQRILQARMRDEEDALLVLLLAA